MRKVIWAVASTRFDEITDFCIIFLSVFILGVVSLYGNVFWAQVGDFFAPSSSNSAVSHTFSSTSIKAPSVFGDIPEMGEHQEEWAMQTSLSQEITSEHFRDFLTYRARSYDLAFNTLPPGKRLIIDAIGVDTPIVDVPYASTTKLEEADFDAELKEGVVKYPFTSTPGEKGTTLLFGHSSVDAWEAKDNPYGQVFAKLSKLNEWDLIKVIWDGQLYIYEAIGKEVKWPKEVGAALSSPSDEHLLTLMACYPLLSDAQRMLVKARLWKPSQLSLVPGKTAN